MTKVVTETDKQAAPRKAGRRPGRPTGAHGADAREHLLDIALGMFAKQGIVETTLGAIAREAGVTPAMVHYYFKTRDQLLDVLIDERFIPLRTELGRAFADPEAEPADALRTFAEALVATVDKHRWFAALWVREVISDGGLLRQRMAERFGDEKEATITRIEQWQKDGKLNPRLEPSLVFVSLFGLTVFPLATWKWREGGRRLTSEQIARHAVALLTQGVGPV
ncbi:transcriptional regulator, TetR family [Caballeronia arationis]|uniref:Transcriptional regulator, TetR family n=1 Tax=Caballeronia arationis TaxID=1777142 RepID=A0A7Z7N2G4_9BURK|nr:TetR/AcrR family transcriptional regulator [Caballeronia arationis]SOE65637.1 transcriptional regulator, TetR family [Caballeronia arationis]